MCLLNLKKVIKTKNTTKLFDNEMMSSDFFFLRNKHTHDEFGHWMYTIVWFVDIFLHNTECKACTINVQILKECTQICTFNVHPFNKYTQLFDM